MGTHADTPTVVLICHEEERLDRDGLASWLASTMRLAGLLIIRNRRSRRWRALRRELQRVGPLGLLDVAALRAYSRVTHGMRDAQWQEAEISRLRRRYPADVSRVPRAEVSSPNAPEARAFLAGVRPDLAIARCKVLLDPEVFEIPRAGTFVLHPGICPEYRNAHGCFWALAHRDHERVGMTLLRVDRGVDTGPVYLHATADYDERNDSHIVIQHSVVTQNLDAIADTLTAIARGDAVEPVDIRGRRSAVWGQPRLTHYLRWKRAARRAAPHKGVPYDALVGRAFMGRHNSSQPSDALVGRPFMGRQDSSQRHDSREAVR